MATMAKGRVSPALQKRQSQQQLLDNYREHLTQVINVPMCKLLTCSLLMSHLLWIESSGCPWIGKTDHNIVYVEYDIKDTTIKQASSKIYLY